MISSRGNAMNKGILLICLIGILASQASAAFFPTFSSFRQGNVTAPTAIQNEVISAIVNFTSGEAVTDCQQKTFLSVISGSTELEVKSNVSIEYNSGGFCLGMRLNWLANITANQNTTFILYFNTTNSSNMRNYLFDAEADNFTYLYPAFQSIWTERNSTTECPGGCGTAGTRTIALTNDLFVKVNIAPGTNWGVAFIKNGTRYQNYTISYVHKFIDNITTDSSFYEGCSIFRNQGNFSTINAEPLNAYQFCMTKINSVVISNFTLSKFVNGAKTIINQTNMTSNVIGDIQNITISMQGNRIQVWNTTNDSIVNLGSPLFDTTDYGLNGSGEIGFRLRESDGAGCGGGCLVAYNFSNFRFTTDTYKVNSIRTSNYSFSATQNQTVILVLTSPNSTAFIQGNMIFSCDSVSLCAQTAGNVFLFLIDEGVADGSDLGIMLLGGILVLVAGALAFADFRTQRREEAVPDGV